jgi:NitT/TauT family transport system substrate-binding protein
MGLYAADQKDFYANEGLKVTFIEGGPNISKISAVNDGIAQFGITSPDELILARADGNHLVAVTTIFRRSPLVFISLTQKGITRPQDFVGKKIRATSNIVPALKAMMAKVGFTPDQYSTVELPSDLTLFSSGDVPVWGVFSNIFAVSVLQAGYKINIIYPEDYGVHFASDTIFTTDELIAKDPDLVLRFIRASLKGWTYSIENPNAMQEIIQLYEINADPNVETDRINATLPLVNTGEDHVGWMKPEVWVNTEDTLLKYGVLLKPVDISKVYTQQFVNEIYK